MIYPEHIILHCWDAQNLVYKYIDQLNKLNTEKPDIKYDVEKDLLYHFSDKLLEITDELERYYNFT